MQVYAENAIYDDPWSYCDTRYKIAGQWYGMFIFIFVFHVILSAHMGRKGQGEGTLGQSIDVMRQGFR